MIQSFRCFSCRILVHLQENDVTEYLTSTPTCCLSATPASRRARPTTALMDDEDAIIVYDTRVLKNRKEVTVITRACVSVLRWLPCGSVGLWCRLLLCMLAFVMKHGVVQVLCSTRYQVLQYELCMLITGPSYILVVSGTTVR
jgi:hypothetical protein